MRLSALSRSNPPAGGEGGPSPLSLSYAARIFFLIFGLVLLSLFTPLSAHAQSTAYPYAPNVDSGVTIDQHTMVQSLTIEVMDTIICQLAGIDVINPNQGCLGVNTTTHKLSYSQTQDTPQIGGLMGAGTTMFAGIYTQPASGVAYVKNLADNFGIVKNTYAQAPGCSHPGCDTTGFNALAPVQKLWLVIRNLTFTFFILMFVIIGIGIMLRFKLGGGHGGHGEVVMNIQNQLPRIVIALILISFSYAIVGLMIDFMWVTTYFGINVLTSAQSVDTNSCNDDPKSKDYVPPTPLSDRVYRDLLTYPPAFLDDVFHQNHCFIDKAGNFIQNNASQPAFGPQGQIVAAEAGLAKGIVDSGFANLSWQVSSSMGRILQDSVNMVVNPDKYGDCSFGGATAKFINGVTFGLSGWLTGNSGDGVSMQKCAAAIMGGVVKVLADMLVTLIVVCALLLAMFRLWFSLLKAYIYVIIYTIIAPIWLLLGLIPGSTLTFGRWIRTLAANLLIFPLAAFTIVGARILMEVYSTSASEIAKDGTSAHHYFYAPLVGNPALVSFGAIIAFGMLMIAPNLLEMLKTALNAPSGQVGGMVVAGFNAGRGAGMYIPGRVWNRQMARGGHGEAAGRIREKLVGTGDPNTPQKIIRALGVGRAFKASDFHTPDISSTGGSGGGGDKH